MSWSRCSDNPFLPFTHTLAHCGLWLSASGKDVIYDNPTKAAIADTFIVCVHGTADRESAFTNIANRLINESGIANESGDVIRLPDNIAAIHLVAFEDRGKGEGIGEFGKQLLKKIIACGYEHVIFMGHSRGGLVYAVAEQLLNILTLEADIDLVRAQAEQFLQLLAPEADVNVLRAEVDELLTIKADMVVESVHALGTPFGGSSKAQLFAWCSKSCEQMTPGSPFLLGLNERIKKTSVPYHFYAAENDELVPMESTYVEGMEDHLIVLRCHSHLTMLSSLKVIDHLQARFAGLDCGLSLQTLQNELRVYIEDFKKTPHRMFSTHNKEYLMDMFDRFIQDFIDQSSEIRYPEAKTIGDFIQMFLTDKTLLNSSTDSVYDTLNASLNFFTQPYDTTTINFFKTLIKRYNQINLPLREEPVIQLGLGSGNS